jgi:hypothetical protein
MNNNFKLHLLPWIEDLFQLQIIILLFFLKIYFAFLYLFILHQNCWNEWIYASQFCYLFDCCCSRCLKKIISLLLVVLFISLLKTFSLFSADEID